MQVHELRAGHPRLKPWYRDRNWLTSSLQEAMTCGYFMRVAGIVYVTGKDSAGNDLEAGKHILVRQGQVSVAAEATLQRHIPDDWGLLRGKLHFEQLSRIAADPSKLVEVAMEVVHQEAFEEFGINLESIQYKAVGPLTLMRPGYFIDYPCWKFAQLGYPEPTTAPARTEGDVRWHRVLSPWTIHLIGELSYEQFAQRDLHVANAEGRRTFEIDIGCKAGLKSIRGSHRQAVRQFIHWFERKRNPAKVIDVVSKKLIPAKPPRMTRKERRKWKSLVRKLPGE